jgi:hypothetical protein
MSERPHVDRPRIAATAAAIALVCIVVLALQIRDRWNSPEIKPTAQAEHATTGQAARTSGAKVLPTDPKLKVEPEAPKQVQPADPD